MLNVFVQLIIQINYQRTKKIMLQGAVSGKEGARGLIKL